MTNRTVNKILAANVKFLSVKECSKLDKTKNEDIEKNEIFIRKMGTQTTSQNNG